MPVVEMIFMFLFIMSIQTLLLTSYFVKQTKYGCCLSFRRDDSKRICIRKVHNRMYACMYYLDGCLPSNCMKHKNHIN